MARYVVNQESDLCEPCECPEHLCKHPDGTRWFTAWVVADEETNRLAETPELYYLRKRDAMQVAAELNWGSGL